MRILIAGHKGYIGAVMVPFIQLAGHEVVGLDSDLFEDCSFRDDGLAPVPELNKDVRDVDRADLEGFDAVIHLANLSNDPLGNLNPKLTYEINHKGSVHLAERARAAGVKRFVFSSSCSLYGAAGEDRVRETAPFNPVTPYGRAKVLAEEGVGALANDAFSPTYLRNATAYGMSPRLRFDLVLNNLTAWAVTTGKIYLKSDGSPWRPLVHIEDISRAFLAVLESPREAVHNQAFNVGSTGENYQIRDIARLVGEIVPNCEVKIASDASPDRRSYRVDFSKITEHLPAFETKWSARDGVCQIYEALHDVDLSPDEFEGVRYRRIDRIRALLRSGELGPDLRWNQKRAQTQ